MKKIIAAALSAAMMFTGVTALADNDVRIDYNGEYIDCQTAPKNVDGRVMLPFRDVLESMGASVDYDDANKLVTASKDGVTITFTLLDDTIYIDNNGAQSQITMDVPMIVEDGHTLVPVRFLSEALGMRVGWENGTVCILDTAALSDELAEKTPNLSKLIELGKPDVNSSKADIKLNFKSDSANATAPEEHPNSFSLDLDLSADTTVGENALGIKAAADMTLIPGGQITAKDANAEIIIADGVIYIKTDALDKIKIDPASPAFDAAAKLIPSDSWYKLDFKELLAKSGMPENIQEQFIADLTDPTNHTPDMEQILSTAIPGGEPTSADLKAAKALVSAYAFIDKFITVTETENGGYTASVKITTDNYVRLIYDILPEYSEDELNDVVEQIKSMLDFNIDVTSSYDGKTEKSEGTVSFKTGDNAVSLNLELSETSQKLDNITEPQIPENAVDLIDILSSL